MKKSIPFRKFHGTGNDFIIIDHSTEKHIQIDNHALIKLMCDRRFGIGADGLMLIEKGEDGLDFNMQYYNSDGQMSSMCGNGGRCITLAAKEFGLIEFKAKFSFKGEIYESSILDNGNIQLKMQDLTSISKDENAFVLDTGSPHYVDFVEDVDLLDMKIAGQDIRYNSNYSSVGINVNFCTIRNKNLYVRTYERGVEDETYSCGTGVVASAISLAEKQSMPNGQHSISISTKGGDLIVRLSKSANVYHDIYLIGPAVHVFTGEYFID